MKLFPAEESRKLSGLYVGLLAGLAALLVFLITAIIAIAIWGIDYSVVGVGVGGIVSLVTLLTGTHQISQSASDRSANYAQPVKPEHEDPPAGPRLP